MAVATTHGCDHAAAQCSSLASPRRVAVYTNACESVKPRAGSARETRRRERK